MHIKKLHRKKYKLIQPVAVDPVDLEVCGGRRGGGEGGVGGGEVGGHVHRNAHTADIHLQESVGGGKHGVAATGGGGI